MLLLKEKGEVEEEESLWLGKTGKVEGRK